MKRGRPPLDVLDETDHRVEALFMHVQVQVEMKKLLASKQPRPRGGWKDTAYQIVADRHKLSVATLKKRRIEQWSPFESVGKTTGEAIRLKWRDKFLKTPGAIELLYRAICVGGSRTPLGHEYPTPSADIIASRLIFDEPDSDYLSVDPPS